MLQLVRRLLTVALWVVGAVMAVQMVCLAQPPAPPEPRRHDRDALGYYQISHRYPSLVRHGITVVDLPEDESFFAYWVPPTNSIQAVMVLLHGTGGTAYDELADEIDMAQYYGYAIVGLQWLDQRSGRYAEPLAINKMLEKALRHLTQRYGQTPKTVALCGFSRGSVTSFEVAYRDRISDRHLDMVIAHSGGIPIDHVTAPGERAGPDAFYSDLELGGLGHPFAGLRFFLYAGCQDEEWGTTMCEYMRNTKELVEKNGGAIAACIIDPQGTHAGYRKNLAYHRQAILLWLGKPSSQSAL